MNLSRLFLASLILTVVSPPLVGQDFLTQEVSQVLLQVPPSEPDKNAGITDLDFSPNGESIAIGAKDGTVRILSIAKESVPQLVSKSDRPVYAVAFSPDARKIASAGFLRATVGVLIEQGKSAAIEKTTQLNGSVCVAFSPNGELLAVGNYNGKATVVSLASNEIQFEMAPFAGAGLVDDGLYKPTTESMDFSPDGKLLAVTTSFFDDELAAFENVQVWDVTTGKLRFFFLGGVCEFSPNGSLLAYRNHKYDGDGRIVLLDLDTFLPAGVLTGRFDKAHFSPDGRSMAAISDRGIELWSVSPGRSSGLMCKRVALLKHETKLTCFAFSPKGRSLVTGDTQGTVRLWHLED